MVLFHEMTNHWFHSLQMFWMVLWLEMYLELWFLPFVTLSLYTLLGVRELWHGQFSSVLPTRYHSHCLWEEHVYSSRVLLLYQLHHVWPCLDCQCRMDCSMSQSHCKLEIFHRSNIQFDVACFLLKLDVSIRVTPWARSITSNLFVIEFIFIFVPNIFRLE